MNNHINNIGGQEIHILDTIELKTKIEYDALTDKSEYISTNINDDNSDRRKNSFHAGLPPINGEKWMCNKWIRLEKHQ